MAQNTIFQYVKNIFLLSQKKLIFFTELNLAIWAMLGTLLGKLSQVCLGIGYNRQGGGSVREARIFQFEMELELER